MTKWEKVEKERESDTSIICVTNVAHERWGEVDCVEINVLPQLGVRFNLQYHILKSEPLDEGQLPEEDFFFSASLFFLYFLLGQEAGVIETRHRLECEAFTAARLHFLTEWKTGWKEIPVQQV